MTYLIKSSRSYDKSYVRLKMSGIKDEVFGELDNVIDVLASGGTLSKKYRDHKLNGDYKGYRECHIKGDLLLVYQIKNKELILLLVDIGSHSYLFE